LSASDNGVVSIASSHSVDETLARLQQLLASRGWKVFAVIDHDREAAGVDWPLRKTKLVICGDPLRHASLMLASPTAALDLPLKLLVWEDQEGTVWVSYNSMGFLRRRHHLPREIAADHSAIDDLAEAVVR
jgi:uncharacterized protein (DUF302 family)